MYEWIGVAGSILIIIAFLFKDEKKIRIADALGAGLFIIYGVTIESFSTVFLNAVLILVQIINLRRLCNGRRKAKPHERMDNTRKPNKD